MFAGPRYAYCIKNMPVEYYGLRNCVHSYVPTVTDGYVESDVNNN